MRTSLMASQVATTTSYSLRAKEICIREHNGLRRAEDPLHGRAVGLGSWGQPKSLSTEPSAFPQAPRLR
jgi:hypothetical protein